MSINYYQILGITSDFPQQSVPQAFRSKARSIHPDKCKQNEKIDESKQKMVQLLQAYRVINDPTLRKQYDINHQISQKQISIQWNRYFHHTNIIQENQRMYVKCEQCEGSTEIVGITMMQLLTKEEQFCLKCWHCGLTLYIEYQ